ncbi:MAG: ATP-dependent Clp protease adaptor ClpS [Spirochaetia bacterium]|jgi:ATP-dependent Clp protease adaptor protein ClpS|nr:ATP-dependent Clp protease adaptor ClpS [Spirochaetia bacterium]MDI9427279.1 ATP-dependent Clp protease adaptor ClpS [Spirochaetota bacterium]NLH88880.1 ATP-dependent Clp protease adaptor ClpS [Treponema sp.]OQC75090.1 MAG: ATP-dependent Clp protease adapter protein ClpS [Spirochaetes bacterium ADurb.Bin001]HPN91351.1 ATP-dependent Clp protease adaptor ClpS [Rectinema sp.]
MGTRVEQSMDTQELTREEIEAREPEEYRIYLINDDFTTIEFVISILMKVFHKNLMEATKLTMEVHRKGRGLAGVYPYDIAITKVQQVHAMARQRGFPLRCAMEKT